MCTPLDQRVIIICRTNTEHPGGVARNGRASARTATLRVDRQRSPREALRCGRQRQWLTVAPARRGMPTHAQGTEATKRSHSSENTFMSELETGAVHCVASAAGQRTRTPHLDATMPTSVGSLSEYPAQLSFCVAAGMECGRLRSQALAPVARSGAPTRARCGIREGGEHDDGEHAAIPYGCCLGALWHAAGD